MRNSSGSIARADARVAREALDGRYALVRKLGEGGLGVVYEATDETTGRRVALKVLRPERSTRADRSALVDEATAWARLQHSNVVEMLDVGQLADGALYLVIELVDGPSLAEVRASTFDLETALEDVLAGLAHAHARGIVHGDVKPANVLVDRLGHAKISDLGAARSLLGGDARPLFGTPIYMAPEQLDRDREPFPETDLYAFGCMALELFTGAPAFEGTGAALRDAKRSLPTRALERLPRGFAAHEEWLTRVLAPRLLDRPATAVDVLTALRARRGASRDEPDAEDRPIVPPTSSRSVEIGWMRERETTDLAAPSERAPDSARRGPAPRSWWRLRALPLVGRAEQQALLEGAIDGVLTHRRPALVLLEGDAGVGKSAIAEWGFREVEERGVMRRALARYDVTSITSSGVATAIRRLLRLPAATSPERAVDLARLRAAHPHLDVDALTRWLDGAATSNARAGALGAGAVRAVTQLERPLVSGPRGVYLWLDDVAWATDGALDLCEALLDASDAAALVVCTARSGSIERAAASGRIESLLRHPASRRVRVDPLDAAGRAALAASALRLGAEAAEAVARVDQRPAVFLQMLYDWTDAGALVPGSNALATEQSIDALLERRPPAAALDARVTFAVQGVQGDPDAPRRVLELAALIGGRFRRTVLADAIARGPRARDVDVLDETLEALLVAGILRADDHGWYRFDHAVFQEALELSLDARTDVHRGGALRAVASAILEAHGRANVEALSRAGALFARAGATSLAVECATDASIVLAWAGEIRRAHEALADARATARPLLGRGARADARREGVVAHANLLFAEARVQYFACDFPRSLRLLRAARRLFTSAGRGVRVAWALAVTADVLYAMEQYAEAASLVARVHHALESEIAEEDAHDALVVRTLLAQREFELATAHGDYVLALRHVERAVTLLRGAGMVMRLLVHLTNYVDLQLVLGDLPRARSGLDEIELCAEQDGSGQARASAHDARLRFALATADVTTARELLRPRLAEVLANPEDPWRRTAFSLYRAWLTAIARADDAVDATRSFVEAFDACPHDEPFSLHAMAALERELGEGSAVALEVRARRIARFARAAVERPADRR